MNIAAVVVTHNRSNLLIKCLQCVVSQSYKPKKVYIIDTASTDNTRQLLSETGFISNDSFAGCVNTVETAYVYLDYNGGGALGFHTGIKKAHESGLYDAYWVMDDDGEPEPDCLAHLVPYAGRYDYIAPLVLDIQNRKELAFRYNGSFSLDQLVKDSHEGLIERANPFNGILYTKRFVNLVGYPKKEMFIWGDEMNYHLRAEKQGIRPVTVLDAIHYHPQDRMEPYDTPFNRRVWYSENRWRAYCGYRNEIYNNKYRDHSFKRTVAFFLVNFWFLTFQKKSASMLWILLRASFDGFFGLFNGHKKYLTAKKPRIQ